MIWTGQTGEKDDKDFPLENPLDHLLKSFGLVFKIQCFWEAIHFIISSSLGIVLSSLLYTNSKETSLNRLENPVWCPGDKRGKTYESGFWALNSSKRRLWKDRDLAPKANYHWLAQTLLPIKMKGRLSPMYTEFEAEVRLSASFVDMLHGVVLVTVP